MDLIRTTSGNIIDGMTEAFKEYGLMKGQDLDHDQVNDFFEIYQIDPDGPAGDRMFLGSDYLASHGIPVTGEGYRQVYRDSLDPGTGVDKTAVITAEKRAEEQMKQQRIRAIQEIKEAAVRL